MIRTLHRNRGASALGATAPGQTGPFGAYDGDEDEDGAQDLDQPEPRLHMAQISEVLGQVGTQLHLAQIS